MMTTSKFPVRPPPPPLAVAAEAAMTVFKPKPKKVLTVAVCATEITLAPEPGQTVAVVGLPARRLHTQEAVIVPVTD